VKSSNCVKECVVDIVSCHRAMHITHYNIFIVQQDQYNDIRHVIQHNINMDQNIKILKSKLCFTYLGSHLPNKNNCAKGIFSTLL
jgi:hypothetical protein